jgi:hypothetical protein
MLLSAPILGDNEFWWPMVITFGGNYVVAESSSAQFFTVFS